MGEAAGGLRRKRNFKGLKLPPVTANAANPDTSVENLSEAVKNLSEQLAATHIEHEELNPNDIEEVGYVGHGNGGTVQKIKHKPSGRVFAKKAIVLDAAQLRSLGDIEPVKKQILREMQILHTCRSEYIVEFFGMTIQDSEIHIYMEYMDCGSLDRVYKKAGNLDEPTMGKVAIAVLEGLVYLYQSHRIIHRDVKPSNILVNSKGRIKLCDFGVSGEAINSVANTFVGTSSYMAPERIQGKKYSVQSDVWSLGLTLMETAIGKFPFPPDDVNLAIFELLQYIINEPVPTLPPGKYSAEFEKFVKACLTKDAGTRPTPTQLMRHEFIQKAREQDVDLVAWAKKALL